MGLQPAYNSTGCAPATKFVREEELLRLLLTGFTVREASTHMRCSYPHATRVARSPEFLLRLREHSSEIAKRLVNELSTTQIEMAQKLEEASAKALEEMIQMMDTLDQPSKLKMNICQDLLDRDPRSSRTKRMELSGAMSHEFINPAVLIHAAATAKELKEYQEKGQLGNGDNAGHPTNSGNGQS
jgi:hypothetical protein